MTLRRTLALSALISSMWLGCNKHQPAPKMQNSSSVPSAQNTDVPPQPANRALHSSGTLQVLYEGVSVPPAKPNEDGPYVFRNVDLDQGVVLSKTEISSDLEVVVNARTLTVGLSSSTGNATNVGSNDPGAAGCDSSLSHAERKATISNQSAPTNYICLRTGEGRLSVVRVLTITEQPTQPQQVNVLLTLEYRTFEP